MYEEGADLEVLFIDADVLPYKCAFEGTDSEKALLILTSLAPKCALRDEVLWVVELQPDLAFALL